MFMKYPKRCTAALIAALLLWAFLVVGVVSTIASWSAAKTQAKYAACIAKKSVPIREKLLSNEFIPEAADHYAKRQAAEDCCQAIGRIPIGDATNEAILCVKSDMTELVYKSKFYGVE